MFFKNAHWPLFSSALPSSSCVQQLVCGCSWRCFVVGWGRSNVQFIYSTKEKETLSIHSSSFFAAIKLSCDQYISGYVLDVYAQVCYQWNTIEQHTKVCRNILICLRDWDAKENEVEVFCQVCKKECAYWNYAFIICIALWRNNGR